MADLLRRSVSQDCVSTLLAEGPFWSGIYDLVKDLRFDSCQCSDWSTHKPVCRLSVVPTALAAAVAVVVAG
eukprot:gene1649-biopygen2512